jgi:hypothetical protein
MSQICTAIKSSTALVAVKGRCPSRSQRVAFHPFELKWSGIWIQTNVLCSRSSCPTNLVLGFRRRRLPRLDLHSQRFSRRNFYLRDHQIPSVFATFGRTFLCREFSSTLLSVDVQTLRRVLLRATPASTPERIATPGLRFSLANVSLTISPEKRDLPDSAGIHSIVL